MRAHTLTNVRTYACTPNTRTLQVVNGPEVLSKYVGQAEENIRNLFAEAESEYKEKGDSSVSRACIAAGVLCHPGGQSCCVLPHCAPFNSCIWDMAIML